MVFILLFGVAMLAIKKLKFLLEVPFLQGVPEQKLRAHLGSFGVTGNLALQPMYTLSGIFPLLSLFRNKDRCFSRD
jgi:hypothetical protein